MLRRTTFFTIQPDPTTVRKQDNYKSWTITISAPYTSSDVDDFPLLLKFNQDNFSDFADVFKNGNWRYLYFYDENNQPLSAELEFVNEVDNEAQVWVRVPSVHKNKDTKLKLVFDKNAKNSLYIGHNEDVKASTGLLLDNTNILDIFGDGSCIACYPFNDNANDLSGNYNGTWSGNEQYVTGKFGKCSSFDGSSRIVVSSFPYDDFTTYTNQTWSLWLKFDSTPTDSQYIVCMGHHDTGSVSGNLFVTLLLNSSNEVYVAMDHRSINSSEAWWMSPTTVQIDRFSHVAVCREQLTWKLYVNGVLKQNETANVQLRDYNKDSLYIGADDNPAQYFSGVIDQFRIFNKSLTQQEVEKLYFNEQRYYITESLALRRPHEISIKPIPKPKISEVSILSNYVDELKENSYQIQDTTNITDIFGDGSCIVFYKFEDNANDETGNYNGTWNGNELYSLGKFGKCSYFDGSSYIQLPDGIEQYFTAGKSWTVSVWARWDAFNVWSRVLDFKGYVIIANNSTTNTLHCAHRPNQSDGYVFNILDFLDSRTRYHILFSFDSSSNRYVLYVNNTSLSETPSSSSSTPDVPINAFGKSSWSADSLFNGIIDQVRIFNRFLTQQEVQKLYEEQKISVTSPSFIQKRSNQSKIFYYKIKETSGADILENFEIASSSDIKDATITKTYQQDTTTEKFLHSVITYFDDTNKVYRRFRTVERFDTNKIHCIQDVSTDGINFQLESGICDDFYIESIIKYNTVWRLYGRDSSNNIIYLETSDFITFSSTQTTSNLPTSTSCLIYYYNSPTLGDRFKALVTDSTDETKIKLYDSSDGITFTYVRDSYTVNDCVVQAEKFLSIGQYSEETGFLLIPVTVQTGGGTEEVEILQTHKAEKFGYFGLPHNFVWNDDYEYVYHCNNELVIDSACMRDSTVNSYHATPRNGLTKSTGLLGDGINSVSTYNAYLEAPSVQLPLTYSLIAFTNTEFSGGGDWRTLYRGSDDHPLLLHTTENLRIGYYDSGGSGFNATKCSLQRFNNEQVWLTVIGEANQSQFYLNDIYLDSTGVQSYNNIFAIGNWQGATSDNSQCWSSYYTECRLLNKAVTQDYLTLLCINTKNVELVNKDAPRYAFEVSIGYESTVDVLDVFNDGSCIAFYRFDNNLNDESGNHNGVMVDGSEEYSQGKFGQGLHIYGSTDTKRRCKLPDNFNTELGGKSCSISAWIKVEEFLYKNSCVNIVTGSGSYTTSDYSQLNIYINADSQQIQGTLRDDSNAGLPDLADSYNWMIIGGFTPNLNQWYHCVVIWDATNGQGYFYVDGSLVASHVLGTAGMSPNSGADGSYIGNHPNGRYNSVVYDQVRIFNKALTQEEIVTLYREKRKL